MAKKSSASAVKAPVISNGALPRVPVTVNGETFFLSYDFNAIARAEELTGLNLFASFDFNGLSVTKFRAMLFASLLKYQPKITLEEAGDLVTAHTLADLTVKMVEAWFGSRPDIIEDSTPGNAEAEASE